MNEDAASEPIQAIDETPQKVLPPEVIKTVQDAHGMSHEDFVRNWLTKHGLAQYMPVQVSEGQAVQARIDHGRWVVDCPFCPGAELADPDDLRFFCLSCYNRGAGGQWLAVIMPEPEERAAIETAMLERPAQFRQWSPGQTVADVQIDNLVQEA